MRSWKTGSAASSLAAKGTRGRGDKEMASIAVGGTVEVHQIGDLTVNERRDLMYVEDGENAALLEKKTTIAEVPQGDGTTAVLTDVQYTVRATDQPNEQEQGGMNDKMLQIYFYDMK